MNVDPIRRRRLHEEVADRIGATILRGDLRPGDQLPSERELTERFQVGRPAVREALISLQKSGLVSITNGERARVTAPSAESILGEISTAAQYLLAREHGVRHFQQARQLFETGIARLAAEQATDDDILRLEQALVANERSIADLALMEETDVAFHYCLAEIAHNPIFTALHTAIVSWLREQRTTSLQSKGAAEAAYAAHRAIFDAVKARDPDAAGEAMRDHLRAVEARYWAVKEGTDPSPAPARRSKTRRGDTR